MEPDFSGYVTKAGLLCTDGRTIQPEAFLHMHGKTVPLVWQHGHDTPENVLGHVRLEKRPDGVYGYGYFNGNPPAQTTRTLVQHGDVKSLSIYASKIVERAKQVFHGNIGEVSIVLAGANPGAVIDNVRIAHSVTGEVEVLDDEAIIYSGIPMDFIAHADKDEEDSEDSDDSDGETMRDVYETLNEKQKNVVNFMIGAALEKAGVEHSDEDETDDEQDDSTDLEHKEKDDEMVHRNVFENNNNQEEGEGVKTGATLTHSQLATLVADGKKLGSFKEAFLAHAGEWGINDIELLFPDAKAINDKPEWITRRIEWVEGVLNATQKLPFSKIKSLSADLTHEEARAKGYIKGDMKKEQFFSIAKRETGPKTIYKKQRLDRDDIIDITEFDVVAWLWVEMRFMLREEIARAILIGDGREIDDPDKIHEDKIRPIAMDDEFYTDVVEVPANIEPGALVEAVIRARENYHGSGMPTAYMLQSVSTDMLLERDRMGRRLYRNLDELASELQVKEIVHVPVLAGAQRGGGDILMILVNLSDYAVGSTRGGEITPFDDFDLDFNQYVYLIETRASGALTKRKTAQVIVRGSGTEVIPTIPTFNAGTGVVTIPTQTGVVYKNKETGVTLSAGAQAALAPGDSIEVDAVPATGYYFPHNLDSDWLFTRTA